MTNLHDARVAAAGEAIYEEVVTSTDLSMSDCERIASAALDAADAVVTVEMIADALRSIPDAEPGDRRDPATVIAEYLYATLFGEVAGDDR